MTRMETVVYSRQNYKHNGSNRNKYIQDRGGISIFIYVSFLRVARSTRIIPRLRKVKFKAI